eukprot:2813945-Lingulodinium_polyedra.AAC.1
MNHCSQAPAAAPAAGGGVARGARAVPKVRQAWTAPKPSPCSAPRSVERASPDGRSAALAPS